jgi:ankyrin repeat/SOCS box protein 13/metal transporter CNNM
VWVLLVLFFPLTFPIALLLDKILGKDHNTFFRRAELRELVKMHGSKTHDNEEPLSSDEVLIVKSCLEMRDKVVEAIMTPLESVFMLSYDAHIDEKVMDNIKLQGHSRVPVYKGERDNIVGMLLVKRLIHLDPEDCTPVTDLEGANTSPPSCATTTPLFDLLNQFQTGCTSHPVSSVPGV